MKIDCDPTARDWANEIEGKLQIAMLRDALCIVQELLSSRFTGVVLSYIVVKLVFQACTKSVAAWLCSLGPVTRGNGDKGSQASHIVIPRDCADC